MPLIDMTKKFSTIQKCALWFAALFLGVYLLDFVPGIMDEHGMMFGLFHMSKLIDLGHLGAGTLGLIGGLWSPKMARLYFWILAIWYTIDVLVYFFTHLNSMPIGHNVLVNTPHILIFIAAYWVALKVDLSAARSTAA